MKMKIRFAFLVSLLLLAGCRNEQLSVKMTVDYEGFDAQEMDDLVASELRTALQSTSTETYTCISTSGRVDIYATAEPGMTSKRFLSEIDRAIAVRRGHLPHGSKFERATIHPQQPIVPEVSVQQTDAFQIDFDQDQLARLGLTMADVSEALETHFEGPVTKQGVSQMENIQLTTSDGKTIPLSEVATIKIIQKPSHVIYTWPEKPQE